MQIVFGYNSEAGLKFEGIPSESNISFNEKKNNYKYFWSKKFNLGACGDWLIGSKAEDSWTSANLLFKKIKKPHQN